MRTYKFFTAYIMLFIFIVGGAFSVKAQKQTFKYNDSWGDAGYTLISSKASKIEVNYSIKDFSITNNLIDGEELQNIELPGVFLFNDAGMPDLPGESKLLAIPEGSKPVLKIVDYRTEIIEGVEMAPAPILPMDTEPDMIYEKNMKIFSSDAFYPANPVTISKIVEIRGVDAVMLGITPFQYNPVTKQLIVYKDIKVEIAFEGGNGYFGENRLRCRSWEPILDDALYNYSSLPQIDFNEKNKNTKDGEAEYVILTIDNTDFTDWAEVIAEYRRKQGISTSVFTISDVPGGNDVSSIEAWVDDMYNNWTNPPAAVLILADYGTGASGITSQSYPHPYSGTYISDNHYADVNNDDLPDITFARITANDASELEVMITKFLDYENSPPTSADFYNHPISALGWQDDRWFQICSEVVGGFWNNELGKETVRINDLGSPANNTSSGPWSTATNTATVTNYFGTSGLGYLPDSPGDLGGFSGGNATDVNNAINAGSFMLQHRDHGLETGWGEPYYRNPDIDGLNNTDLCFIMSINCLTGQFDYSSESFAEKFHRYTEDGNNSGALGLVAASQVSYSFVNDTYVWGCYDNMWPEFMPGETSDPESRFIYPAFSNVAGKNFLYQSSWPYNTDSKQITYRLFHHHGDPYLNVYSEVPQNLSVTCANTHIFGNMTIDITANNGATIAVTYFDTNDQETKILGTGISTGGATTINLASCPNPGTDMLVTITKQNYFRYTQDVTVIAPSGPYDIVEGFVINDGDNNQAEYGETFNLDITLKNVGVATSEGVTATLTTSDPYVASLTNATNVSYPNIAVDASQTSSGSFTIELANDVPDQHTIQFEIIVSDNSTKATYESNISLVVNAPVLTIGSLTIDDSSTGNDDGILDPGETADIIIQTTNTGHADVTNAIGNIVSASTDMVINSATTSPIGLDIAQTGNFSFNVTAEGATPEGTPVDIDYTITAGVADQYTADETKQVIIGFVPEYCDAGATTPDEWIERVQFVDIDNTTTFGGGYNDYTHISTDVTVEDSYPITITNGHHYSSDQMGCWIDWNYDGDFDDANETITITYSDPDGTGTVTVPTDARIGSTTMRLRVAYTSGNEPCGTASFGEVEDYTLNVLPNGAYAGTASANTTQICESGTTTLTLSGWTGDAMQWQSSPDGSDWSNIGGATSSPYTTATITSTTYYRAEVTMSGFDPALSNSVTVNVNTPPTAGTATADENEICEGGTVELSLSGHSGDIQWQSSPNGSSWSDIGGATSTPYTTAALTSNTYFRAELTTNSCPEEYTASVSVTVNATPVGGTASADETVICTGNSTTLTLTGYTGDIQWQDSPNGSTWSDIASANSATYTTPNLTATTYYQAVLSSPTCVDVNSTSVEIEVVAGAVAGTAVSDEDVICEGETVTLTLSNYAGNIQWQSSPDGTSWSDIASANSETYTSDALDTDTYFRANVSVESCGDENTDAIMITVDEIPIAGTASADATTLCTGSSTTLTLADYTGNIQWQNSPDGSAWSDIASANSETYTTENLTTTTHFRAVVSNGVCADENSNAVEITIVEEPVADFTSDINNYEVTFSNNSTNATSYSWDFGDDTGTSTDENPIYVYAANGTYTVVLTASNGICDDQDFSDDIIINVVSISDLANLGIELYPNPNTGVFTVETSIENMNITITDVTGRIVHSSEMQTTKQQIDISDNESGVYLIRFEYDNKSVNSIIILK